MTDNTDLPWVEFGGYSRTGRRSNNQDALVARYPTTMDDLIYKGVVGCIADGVSCSHQSQQASHTTVTQFVSDYYSTPASWSVKHSVSQIIKELNSWLYRQGKQDLTHNGMVTTFSTIILKSNTAHLFHSGDSRIYLYRNQQLSQLTRDHQRTSYGHHRVLTRALGMDEHVELDYTTLLLQENDVFLLSTDGIHDYLSHDTLCRLLANPLPLESLCQNLCDMALECGSRDNVSCLALRVNVLPDCDQHETQQILLTRHVPPVLQPEQYLDQYKIIKVIYAGRRSHVYLAQDTLTGEKRVIKAPSLNDMDDMSLLRRFANEYWIASQLDSHRVMAMYPCPENTIYLYQVCEFIEGITLRQWMYDHPTPPLEEVRDILYGIIRALRVFQRADMVHRDLKPENVMITTDNMVKIIDFGSVMVEGEMESRSPESTPFPLGAVNYTAPEYINSGQATILSDLFSAAVIGYELLCGELPYREQGSVSPEQSQKARREYRSLQTLRPDIPEWIDAAFRKATSVAPEQRYQALGDFITDLYTPNMALLVELHHQPLRRKHPLMFWRTLAALALIAAMIEGLVLCSVWIR